MRHTVIRLAVCFLMVVGFALTLNACPFCTAVSQTFGEEMASMDTVVLARLVKGLDKLPEPGSTRELPMSKFQIVDVIKGDAWAKKNQSISVHYFGKVNKEATYLIMGTDPPNVLWGTPLALSGRGREYILQLPKLPQKGPDRLTFFLKYFEDKDEMLARDAYDEFAKVPYEDVKVIKDRMDREQILQWIQDADIAVSRRRLYLTMLGICGQPADAKLLEKFMRSSDKKKKAGLDAMVACYLTLKGQEGMQVVEELLLANKQAEYADTYAAIMAIRFLGSQTEAIPRERLLAGLRHVLARPDLADLVIPDLARWEDWSVMPQLVELFAKADKESNWVRVPIVNYLRACPLDKAKLHLEKLKDIDPEAVKRARTFFPLAPSKAPQRTTSDKEPATADSGNNDVKSVN